MYIRYKKYTVRKIPQQYWRLIMVSVKNNGNIQIPKYEWIKKGLSKKTIEHLKLKTLILELLIPSNTSLNIDWSDMNRTLWRKRIEIQYLTDFNCQ